MLIVPRLEASRVTNHMNKQIEHSFEKPVSYLFVSIFLFSHTELGLIEVTEITLKEFILK